MLAEIAETLESDSFIAAHRVNPTDFTRRRTLTFSTKLHHSGFHALNQLLLARWANSMPVSRWHGWRLVAADTTTLRLPGLPETVAEFGLHGDRWGGATPMAVAFGLYDVASSLMIHADLHPANACERALLAGSLDQVRADDLLLLDRGFPSFWLFAWLLQRQRHLAARIGKWQTKYPKLVDWAESNIGETLTFYRLPRPHHKHMKSTNMLERLNEEIKRRTHVVHIFPNTDSCLRLIRALCVETHESWLEDNRYLNMMLLVEQKKDALRLAA